MDGERIIPAKEKPRSIPRSLGRGAVLLLAFWMLAFLGRLVAGAADSSFGAYEDEPAHLVTALMIRDFIAGGDYTDPRAFAADYYASYPKVAFGQWPPILHFGLGLWTLVFGDARYTILLLMTLVAALGGLMTRALALAAGMPRPVPLLAGLLFLALPMVQEYSGLVMTEGPLAMTCGVGLLGLTRLLEKDDGWGMFLFIFGSIASLLIKGTAISLAFLPGLVMIFAWRWDRLFSVRLWLSALVVGVCSGPWYALFYESSTSTWSGGTSPSVGYALYALEFYRDALPGLGGSGVLVLAVLGFVFGVRDREQRLRWLTYLAWLPSTLLVLILVPSSAEARHLILLGPVVSTAAIGGAWQISRRLVHKRPEIVTALLAAAAFFPLGFRFPEKNLRGFDEVALRCLLDARLQQGPFLVASDAAGEGMVVSEFLLARREASDSHILRASKLLGSGDWLGRGYEPRFETINGLEQFLLSLPISALAIDMTTKQAHWFEHIDQLLTMVGRSPERWREIARIDVVRDGVRQPEGMLLYELVGHGAVPRKPIGHSLASGQEQRSAGLSFGEHD